MTISCEKTGDLYLSLKSFQVVDNKRPVDIEVKGYTQGLGGEVRIKTGGAEKIIYVGPCLKVLIFGMEFWGEYSDHPKRELTEVSLVYPLISP